ncbi:MAG TPA: MinD/ParA family protein [Spirochaetota bacterium]
MAAVDQASALRKLAAEKKDERHAPTRTIAITSGKGGVGKTSLAVSLSIALAQGGKTRVTLLDADLGLANINVILGIIPQFNLYHVIKGKKKLRDIVIDVPEGIKIIAGASGFHQLANLDIKQRKEFIDEFQSIEGADFMIIDTGAGVSQNVLSFVVAADEVIVVTTPEPTAITDAYGIIKSIAAQTNDKVIRLIVNRVQSVSEGKRVAQRIINIAGQFLNIKVENLGFIFDDPFVAKSVRNQKPFIVGFPKAKSSVCVSMIADRIANRESELKGGGLPMFLKNLFKSEEVEEESPE